MSAAPHVHGGEQIDISGSSNEQALTPYLILTTGETYFLVCLFLFNSICLMIALCVLPKLTQHLTFF